MRTKKRLKYVREETFDGLSVYRAKRKKELALIVPRPEGGYAVALHSEKCKQRTIAPTIADAKHVVEAMRVAAPRRNPIARVMPSSKSLWWAAGGAAVAIVATMWFENRANAETKPGGGGGGGSIPAPPPVNPPATQVHVTLSTNPTQSTSWNGGTMFVDLPAGATGWVSVAQNGGAPLTTNAAGALLTPDPLQLPANPRGTYGIVYTGPGGDKTTTLTVT